MSGQYDDTIREQCIKKIKELGVANPTEGSIQICIDTFKTVVKNYNKWVYAMTFKSGPW